ncbi:hypothetical protein QBC43DRAFT_73633 [Cladorrhinum sp. PSN259]|nr:hypothetical protein QBC43DRAFT_73633 [Cladorrhinum sp. PSN259]
MNANNRPRLAEPSPQNSPVSPETEKRGYGAYQAASSNGHGQLPRSPPGPDISPPEQPPSLRYFILKAAFRWFITALLCTAYYAIVRLYEGHTLSPKNKSVFDWLTIGVTLLLGLNIGSAYKEIALQMKPWFDARSGVNIRNVELSSLLELIKLMWKTRSTKTRLVCALWVFLNVMVQAGIAAVSLTYSADPDPEAIYLAPGNITIPNLSRFTGVGEPGEAHVSAGQNYAAHILGEMGALYNFTNLPKESLVGAPIIKYPWSFWNATDHWEYIFMDSAPSPGPSDFNFLSVYSNRTVKSSAICTNPVYTWSSNDSMPHILTIYHNDTGKVVYFPMAARMREAITYLTRSIPRWFGLKEETTDCGPGCSTVYVTETITGEAVPGTYYNDNSGFFYHECNVTVLPTDLNDKYTLPPMYGAMAAQSIALAGYVDPVFSRAVIETEYVQYDLDPSFGGRQYNSNKGVADMLARFAIGTVAAMAQTNPKVTVTGNQPRQGVRLEISLPVGFAIVLLLVALVQLLLLVLAVVLVQRLPRWEGAPGMLGEEYTGLTPPTSQSHLFSRLEHLVKPRRSPQPKTNSLASPTGREPLSQPLLSPQPDQPFGPVERQSNHPDSSENSGLHGGEHEAPHDHEPAYEREDDSGQYGGLVPPLQPRLAVPQNQGTDNRQEEEGVLAQAVEGQQGPEVAQEDVEGRQHGREHEDIDGGVGTTGSLRR